ncbi:sensor N-terminal transmembrane domain-containing protein [Sphingomonas sabuli]|uniref:histidine kinase n=1 Tax=Sphingomonas sabuli TaxID=2764186 RepID=A0A7G9L337_9SPHN|nr:ATP-binding protein [Sphingomonas sabuli]QNM83036.1 sensor N-terminal transmembrane domain-containing protein [Sphingomonas sabuli]
MARKRHSPRPWAAHWTLTWRILAVNIFTVLILALGVIYLDSFRNKLAKERVQRTEREAEIAAIVARSVAPERRDATLVAIGQSTRSRIRIYGAGGRRTFDSWASTGPTYELRDPAKESWMKDAARAMDRGFNALVGAKYAPDFAEPAQDSIAAWPEAQEAARLREVTNAMRTAPDLTPVLSAAAPVADGALLVTSNERSLIRSMRSQRAALALAMAAAILISVLLSLFLARTIVRPLRRIALAAHRVRLGRAREVRVPRLPSRRDEIGLLARSVADMSQSLRHRIDNIEAFAADVTHELKNPLASLRSALDGLGTVTDDALRNRLTDVAREDVRRLDRLISDISEAARTDAELARARFEEVDLGALIEQLVAGWNTRRERGNARIAFARPRKSSTLVMGDPGRLARAIDNLLDNAISFSPPGGLVEIAATRVDDQVRIRIDDEGPGVPQDEREAIFHRFHSIRPETEDFGRHSGLGLAIAKAIVEGHDGEISVFDRDDAPSGARFIIALPAVDDL